MDRRLDILAARVALVATVCAWAPAYAEDAGAPDLKNEADNTAVEASLSQTVGSSEPIKVGEVVQVTFEIDHPSGSTVSFPSSYSPPRWVLVDAQKQGTSEAAKKSVWVATFSVFQPGHTTLEPFEIEVATAAGTKTLTTQPVDLKVISAFADVVEEPEFEAPRPGVPVWVDDYALAYLGGTGLAFALLGLGLWWARRRELLKPPPPPPPRAPHEVALEKLGALAGDDLVERGEYMIFWVGLSEAVREYLGRAYGFPPHELTTTEVLDQLRDVRWPERRGFVVAPDLDLAAIEAPEDQPYAVSMLADISDLLRRCDEVKFGGAAVTLEGSNKWLRRAFALVELTKPRVAASIAPVLSPGETAEPSQAEEVEDDSRWAPPTETGEEE